MANTQPKPILPLSQEDVDRFWSKVSKGAPDECWPWLGPITKKGYGQFHPTRTTSTSAHRQAFKISGGVLRDEEHACHSCDVRYPRGNFGHRRCCNPSHIFAGTAAVNNADMRKKGRDSAPPRNDNRGSRNGAARLDERLVKEILELAKEFKQSEIAAKIAVSRATVCRIVGGRAWVHVSRQGPRENFCGPCLGS